MTFSYISDMASRASKPVTVSLGDLKDRAEARVRSGDFASMSEVVRAGLRALDREEVALEALLRAKVAEALNDGDGAEPLAQAMSSLRAELPARHRPA